jgi:oligopeptide/dipeptide ABC transporter ATP-binding protein
MQIIFQDSLGSLDPRMNVGNSIGYALKVHGLCSSHEQRKKVGDLLERVGLKQSFYNRLPHQLSGGQRQRVGIARALIVNPKLIVADEPVAALDLSAQAQILNFFKELLNDAGVSYAFITHDLNVAAYMCDRIMVMYGGKVVEISKTDQIYENPGHPYTQALISAAVLGKWKDTVEEIILEGDPPNPVSPPHGCKFNPRCPQAGPYCQQVEPELKSVKQDHQVACHLAHGISVA